MSVSNVFPGLLCKSLIFKFFGCFCSTYRQLGNPTNHLSRAHLSITYFWEISWKICWYIKCYCPIFFQVFFVAPVTSQFLKSDIKDHLHNMTLPLSCFVGTKFNWKVLHCKILLYCSVTTVAVWFCVRYVCESDVCELVSRAGSEPRCENQGAEQGLAA